MASDRDSGGDDDEFYEPDDIAELHQGIVNNDLDLLRQVLESGVSPNEKFPADVNPQHEGMTPLALASALNKVEAVKLLLTYQANVNDSFASLKTTALMTSSFHGHTEIVRILLRKGADVRAVDLQGSTALGYAFGGARTIEVIHQLLKAGIDVNQKNMLGMNALLLVAGYGNDVLAKMILDAGADANSTNDFGHSALHLTVVGKRSQIKKLMSTGQTGSYGLNRRNIDVALKEWARLHRDSLRGQDNERELEKVGEFMMSIGSKLDERDNANDDDNEAMKQRVEAVWRHRQDKIQAGKEKKKPGVLDNFLSCGGKRSKQAKHGPKSPAAKPFDQQLDNFSGRPINSPDADRDANQISESCSKILRMIIDSGCEIDKMEKTFGMTALDMAILLGDVESTAILVAAGGDSNHLMKMFALTDLHEALVQLNKKQVKELLTFDTDIDVNQPFSQFNISKRRGNGETDQLKSDGLTPLTVAAQLNEVEVLDIMKLLQKQGADINKVGPGGSCPLAEACRTGNLKMVQFLVSQGADIETRCPAYKDATPVTVAAIYGHRLVVEFLLAKDAKIDKPMSDGRSALIKAVENSDWEMVEQIFNANLNDNFSDHNNFSYDMAERYQRPDRDFDTLKHAITEEARRFADRDREESMQANKAGRAPASMASMVGQQNQRRQTSLDDPVPSSYGRMGRVPEVQLIPEQQRQQRPEQQKQQSRQHPPKPPSPEESSEEEEEDEEEEKEQQQRLRQQQTRQQQQQQPKQVQQQQQQKQQKQQKQHNPPVQPPPARPPPPPAESSSEEEEDEEEEFSNRQQLKQQPKQQQQQLPKQQQQQLPKQQQQQQLPKQQQQQLPKQQQQMKEQQIRKPLPPQRTSSEEEDDEEEEVRKPQQQQQQQQRHPAAVKLAVPAAAPPQKKPESSEEEDDDDDEEDEEDEEEEVKPVPPVQGKKQVVPQMPATKPPGSQPTNAAKPVQKPPPSSEEEEETESEEEESEEEVRAPPPKATPANILPSAKFETRTFQAMPNHSATAAAVKGSPARPNNVQAKQNNSSAPNRAPGLPAAASVRSPMSPSGPPPPLPSTGPPSKTPTESEEDDDDEESDEDFAQNHAPVAVAKDNKFSSPSKNKASSSQSTVTTTKGSSGVVTRTVVTKTVVTSNVTARNEPAKGRSVPAKVEVSDDDDEDDDDDDYDDEEEESDEDNERARFHSTETDI